MSVPVTVWLMVLAAEPQLLDRIVATVDYQVITESELKARTRTYLEGPAHQRAIEAYKSQVLITCFGDLVKRVSPAARKGPTFSGISGDQGTTR